MRPLNINYKDRNPKYHEMSRYSALLGINFSLSKHFLWHPIASLNVEIYASRDIITNEERIA